MLVIADASPLHYLVLIAAPDILPLLFGRVVVPRVVAQELQHPQTPTLVRLWMAAPPAWLDIHEMDTTPDASLAHLDPGEQAAITLAQALHADLLLMDEWEGRQEAERRALTVTGVLGVLERAAQQELIDLPSALTRLLATNFYAPTNLVRDMLTRDAIDLQKLNWKFWTGVHEHAGVSLKELFRNNSIGGYTHEDQDTGQFCDCQSLANAVAAGLSA